MEEVFGKGDLDSPFYQVIFNYILCLHISHPALVNNARRMNLVLEKN